MLKSEFAACKRWKNFKYILHLTFLFQQTIDKYGQLQKNI